MKHFIKKMIMIWRWLEDELNIGLIRNICDYKMERTFICGSVISVFSTSQMDFSYE